MSRSPVRATRSFNMQALSRASLALPFRSPTMYYLSMTAHGTLMAIVFTTFFIMMPPGPTLQGVDPQWIEHWICQP